MSDTARSLTPAGPLDARVIEMDLDPRDGGRPLRSMRQADAAPASAPGRFVMPLDGLPRRRGRALGPSDPRLWADPGQWSGEYAFATMDPSTGAIRAWRDPYGARPLYYQWTSRRLLLAGEIPALLARLPVTPSLDETTLVEYLATGRPSEGRTFHQGLCRLPAGSLLAAGDRPLEVLRWFSPWDGPGEKGGDPEEAFRELLRDAVQDALGDGAPGGVLLSGGPDSAAVLGMAGLLARQGALPGGPLRAALTMTFRALHACDESSLARRAARRQGIRWIPVGVERESPLDTLGGFLRRHGEPPCTVNLALESQLMARARRAGIVSLLDGHDADGLFYPSGAYLHELLRSGRWVDLVAEIHALNSRHGLRLARLFRLAIAPALPLGLRRLRRRAPRWIGAAAARRADLEQRLQPPPRREPFEAAEAARLFGPQAGLALEAIRTIEKLHDLEGRHPFFHPPLVRFLLSLPLELRFHRGRTKILLRRSLGDLLPMGIRRRMSKTSYKPYLTWSLRTHLSAPLRRLAGRAPSPLDPYIDRQVVRSLSENLLQGRPTEELALWRMVVLERWLQDREAVTLDDPDNKEVT